MTTNEAKAIMKKRARIERVNANFKNRDYGTLLVRGFAKVQAIGLWHVLDHNLTIALRLRAMPASAVDSLANIPAAAGAAASHVSLSIPSVAFYDRKHSSSACIV
jgi:hypothetical protein